MIDVVVPGGGGGGIGGDAVDAIVDLVSVALAVVDNLVGRSGGGVVGRPPGAPASVHPPRSDGPEVKFRFLSFSRLSSTGKMSPKWCTLLSKQNCIIGCSCARCQRCGRRGIGLTSHISHTSEYNPLEYNCNANMPIG